MNDLPAIQFLSARSIATCACDAGHAYAPCVTPFSLGILGPSLPSESPPAVRLSVADAALRHPQILGPALAASCHRCPLSQSRCGTVLRHQVFRVIKQRTQPRFFPKFAPLRRMTPEGYAWDAVHRDLTEIQPREVLRMCVFGDFDDVVTHSTQMAGYVQRERDCQTSLAYAQLK